MISTSTPLARLLSFTVSLSMFVTGPIFLFSGLFTFGGGPAQQTESGYRKKGAPVAGLPSVNQIRAPKPEVKMQEKFKTLPRKKTDKCNLNNVWCLQRKAKKQAGLFTPEGSDKPANKIAGSGNKVGVQRAIHKRIVPPSSSQLDIAAGKVNSGLRVKNVARRHLISASTPVVKAGAKPAPVGMAMTPPGYPATIYQAKLDRRNRVGEPGVDLLSGNFHWSVPLMEFPGRADLDLGVSLSNNSRRWIRSGNHLNFDPDYDIAPGFSVSLPQLDGPYFERGPTIRDFILILGSGKRIELRDVGARTFRSFDSSFLEMREAFTGGPMTLRTPDGTALKFVRTHPQLPYWRCVEIKDRYGNFITITYAANNYSFDTITDSLGRTISFIYDENYFLTEIRQIRDSETFVLAIFDYGEKVIQTNFAPGLTSDFNGSPTPVLESVTLADGSKYAFEYTSYIQVKTIRRQVTDGTQTWERAWTSFNLPDPSAGATPQMSDCPVFTQRTNWAGWWGQATTNYSSGPNNNYAWGSMTTPDGTLYREWFHDDNGGAEPWKLGLRFQTDTWASGNNPPTPPSPSGGNPNKKTSVAWEQANTTGFGDPRPQSIDIYDDAGNRKSSVFTYTSFNLPARVDEYGGTTTQQSLLRYTENTYELSSSYTGGTRHIIGLPKTVSVRSGGGVLSSKVEYVYDDYASIPLETLPVTPTQFVSPGTNVLGLVTQRRRYDVNSPSSYLETKSKYYPTGQPAKVIEPTVTETVAGQPFTRTNQVTISYADSFAAPGAPSPTHAYPTSVTGAENHTSTTQYNYHTGLVTKATDPKGASVTMLYDTADRIQRVTNDVSQAYVRYAYAPDQFYINKWTTIENGQGEFFSYVVFDGHDRPFLTLQEHPGITGAYSVVYSTYDNMGRLYTQSNPTETDSNWGATGDDAAGYAFSAQKYDWKGRPRVTYFQGYNPDPMTPPSENEPYKEREIIYGGCGCSGGETMTIIDAGQMTDTGHQRRKRKVVHDELGRVKIEQVFEWEAAVSPYSTKTTTYDASDRVTNIEERAESTGVTQNTGMIYDGYGRLWQRRLPEFQDGAYQTYEYNDDDTLKKTTDARGAVGNFGYYPRKQIRIADYEAPPDPNMTGAPTVNFKYDGAGNMTEMDDGPGKVKYVFDTLSHLTEEKRFFDALDNPDQSVPPDPEEGGRRPFILKYEYNLTGQIKKFTDPRNDFIQYSYNRAGSLTSVTGSSFAGVTNYVTGIQYRAWGSPKQASYGSGHTATSKYSIRMQIQQYDLPNVMGATYTHNPDGRLRTMKAATDAYPTSYDRRMDRSFLYDHAGRTTRTRASYEAGLGGGANFQFRQDYSYDAFSNMTSRGGMYWPNGGGGQNISFDATYTNNIATTVSDNSRSQTWTYDEMGYLAKVTTPNPNDPNQPTVLQDNVIDAVGRIVEAGTVLDGAGQVVVKGNEYSLRSLVFGGQVATYLVNGVKSSTRVYVGRDRDRLADQVMSSGQQPARVDWYYRDPLNTMLKSVSSDLTSGKINAIDPLGVTVVTTDGVNLGNYYACMFDPQSPGCTGQPPSSFYTPQSASGGSASPGSWGIGVRVDGRLSLFSIADIMASAARQGMNASVNVSPALIGTSLTQGTAGSFARRQGTYWEPAPPDPKHPNEANWVERTYDTWDFVPGGEPQGGGQQAYDPRADFRDYALQLSNDPNRSDCLKLALLAYKAGKVWAERGTAAVASGMLNGLTEYSDARLGDRSDPNFRVGVFRTDPQTGRRDPHFGRGFSDTGFKLGYRERGRPGNQVRHFTFYLAAGNQLGPGANAVLNELEGTSDSSVPDVGLGETAIKMGELLATKAVYDPNKFPSNFAQDIWKNICGETDPLKLP